MHICQVQTDAIFVLPTGSGKSMLFLLPVMLAVNKLAVVIIPLVALQEDLMKRCSHMGIPASRWKDRHVAGSRIVFCSCEHVETEEYAQFLNETEKTNRLLSIFVDEVHLLDQWSDFRPVMKRIATKIRADTKAPVYGLTATCPPCLQPDISRLINVTNPTIIRQSNSRANLSYEVMKVDESTLLLDVLTIVKKDFEAAQLMRGNVEDGPYRYIMYCKTRDECDQYKLIFQGMQNKFAMHKYHAGMKREERKI